MPDLSAYASFSAVLDKSLSSPEIRVTDTSPYPGGIAAGITGIVTITQPDLITVVGDFLTPDIIYSGGNLTVAHKELRLGTPQYNFQKGTYIIIYTVRHSGYTDTVITKTFTIDFARPTATISPAFDVFTPSLHVNDTTDYAVSGFTLASDTRSWTATITGVGSLVGGNVNPLDLVYLGNYYDAVYVVSLNSTVIYTLVSNTAITLKDLLTVTGTFSTEKPPVLNALYTSLTSYKINLDTLGCSDVYDKGKQTYIYATVLFQHFMWWGLCSDKTYLLGMVDEIRKTLHDGVQPVYTPTMTIIPAYDFNNFCGCCASGGGGGGGGGGNTGGNIWGSGA